MKLNVFFSWQTETDDQGFTNRQFLIDCIYKSFKQIQDKGQLKGIFFELKEGLRGESGTPEVAPMMRELIDNCDIFIGDFTITQHIPKLLRRFIKGRRGCNINVAEEFGRANGKFAGFEKQVVLVMNSINGNPKDNDSIIHFDARGRRWPITFRLKSDKVSHKEAAEKELMKELPNALREAAKSAIENKDKKYLPFIGWKEHSMQKSFSGKFIPTNELESYKEVILSAKTIRITGLSGLGKTRLVLESFRDSDYKDHYLYCNCQQYSKSDISRILESSILKDYPEAIIILDNCEYPDFIDYLKLHKSYGSLCRLITIFNNPDETTTPDVVSLKLERGLEEVVVEIIRRFVTDDRQLNRIKEFAGGIPLMAELLAKGIQRGESQENVQDETLISRILGESEKTDKRKMLQTLSLFDFIGWKEELRGELEYVATHKDITVIDGSNLVLLNTFDSVIKDGIRRSIIEQRGRRVGLRPMPLAIYLILEWLKDCSSERFIRVLKAIQDSPHSTVLTGAFHRQFKFVGFNDTAQEILNEVLTVTGPFGNAEVINTEVGSLLLRTFAEISPRQVSDLLYAHLSAATIESLNQLTEGRRNLVWLLEKLCFIPELFDKSAYLLMRLGIAENEEFANNATGQFLRLFPILLPSTSASLTQRIVFLRSHIKNEQNINIIFKAIKTALSTSNFIYMQGAEELGGRRLHNYEPSNDEIVKYLSECLNLIDEILERDEKHLPTACEILVSNVAILCRSGFGNLILPYIKSIAERKNYNWDEMWDQLTFFKDVLSRALSNKNQELYNQLVGDLAKSDIVSRFRRVEKDVHHRIRGNFSKTVEKQQEAYDKLAHDFIEQGYNKSILSDLLSFDTSFSYPFGSTLAQICDEKTRMEILTDSIEILNADNQKNPQILIDFINRLTDEEFDLQFVHISKLENKRIIYSVVGRRGLNLRSNFFEHLIQIAHNDNSSYFYSYLTSLDLTSVNPNILCEFLDIIQTLPQGIETTIRITYHLVSFSSLSNSKFIDYIIKFVKAQSTASHIFSLQYFPELCIRLLELTENRPDFATAIMNCVISYIREYSTIFINDYNLDSIFELLLEKYFNEAWPLLGDAILSDDDYSMLYIRLKNIIYQTHFQKSLLEGDDKMPVLKEWCETDAIKAPVRLIPLIQWHGDNNGFSELAMHLIDKYGDNELMLEELSCSMGSFATGGSSIPVYENRKHICSLLLNHSNENVRRWAEGQIISYDNLINRMSNFEAEHKL